MRTEFSVDRSRPKLKVIIHQNLTLNKKIYENRLYRISLKNINVTFKGKGILIVDIEFLINSLFT